MQQNGQYAYYKIQTQIPENNGWDTRRVAAVLSVNSYANLTDSWLKWGREVDAS